MDPFAAVGLVVIGGALGYTVAAQRHAKGIRLLQKQMFSMNIESCTRLGQAAVETLVEDYGHPLEEARSKLFKRCEALGMRLMVAKSDGTATPVNTQEKQS